MNEYQTEQWQALNLARAAIACIHRDEAENLKEKISRYMEFRGEVDLFLSKYFGSHCTQSCFENRLSACCSKDGIVTFWADIVINALLSSQAQLADCSQALSEPASEHKCTYLGPTGCRWHVRPLMCAMFLCDAIKDKVFTLQSELQGNWESLQARAKDFRWPDKPVLFDWLEGYFLDRGIQSPLMYINMSPGLLRIKQKAGLR